MINILFNNIYYKILFAIVLSLILAFSDRIDILKNGGIVMVILFLLLLMIFSGNNEDMGIILLLSGLFILSYNNVLFRS